VRLAGVAAVAFAALVPPHPMSMSPFKALPSFPDKRFLETRHGPTGRVDRVAIPSLHFAPGLSLLAESLPEGQEGLFVDGHLVGAIDRGSSAYLEETLGALPFVLAGPGARPRTALLGVGPDLARADVVFEENEDLLEASGANGEAVSPRAALRRGDGRYDVLVHHVSDLHPATETPLLTVEGLSKAVEALSPDGSLAVSCRVSTPPRGALRLLLTADLVTSHVVAARTSDRLCVLLRRRALTEAERGRVLSFCASRGFDPLRPRELAPARPLHASFPLEPPGAGYAYDVSPVTDARPYFHKSFAWSRLGDVFERERVPFVQWAYVASLVGLVQVALLSLLLVVVPLVPARAARSPALLFTALGLAYMLLEMAFLARAMLRVGSPVHAASAVIGGFLVGSGLGSLAGERLRRPLRRAALVAAVLAPIGYLALPGSAALAAAVCAVVAFPMGMPFPAALSRLAGPSVPWALAWNGCASVVAAAAAPLVSSTFGIPATGLLAVTLYAAVALLARRANPRGVSAHP
jgi:hypothetical protein